MTRTLNINLLWGLLTVPLSLITLYLYLFKRKPKLNLKNKVVFISGASSGLGEACAMAFFTAGCKVILSGRKQENLEAVKEKLLQMKGGHGHEPAIVVMDLENLDDIPVKMKTALSLFGCIDIVVNNAGITYRGFGYETKLDVYQKLMTVNFLGHVEVTKAVLPQMMERKSGQIVVVGSLQGLIAIPNRTAYAASKHAVTAYFDSLRAELSLFDIDVCVVSPYYIKTNLSLNAVQADGSNYGELDKTTASGMDANDVADQIVECVTNRTKEKVICPILNHMAICMRTMAPSLYFKVMEMRARKESSTKKKNS